MISHHRRQAMRAISTRSVRRYLIPLFFLCALFLCQAAAADTLGYGSVTADSQAAYVDFGYQRVESLPQLEAFLDQMPNLKKCDMFATNMTRAWAKELSERYPDVEFGWTFRINCTNKDTHIIRTDMEVFSTLHNNQSLQHTSEDFEVLRYCTHLKALDLGHNAVTDLNFVSTLTDLRVLIIGRNQVTSLEPLQNCTKLEYLEAFTNRIESIAPLLSCTHLMDLNIPNNRVKDPELFAQLTSLRRLWAFNYAWSSLNDNQVAWSLRSMVASALPGCETDWKNSGTGGTWRTLDGTDKGKKVPHYEVIYQMFQSGEYIPFAESEP